MKIKKILTKNNKLINLKLFKTKSDTKIKSQIKKALQLIYKFHINNKKILFIGTDIKSNRKIQNIIKNTKHNFIPESIWINGVITNSYYIFKSLSKKHIFSNENSFKFLVNLKYKNNLIVILNKLQNTFIITECFNKRIPIISFSPKLDLITYKVLINTNNKSKSIFLYSILNTIFKKAEKLRIKKIKYNLLQKSIKKKYKHKPFKKYGFFKKKKI